MTDKYIWALGLMSGTSLDGVDAALIRTDGESIAECGAWLSVEYDEAFRAQLAQATKRQGDLPAIERELTLRHAQAAQALMAQSGIRPDVIGFHGQTIDHRPAEGISWQLGNGALLAAETGVNVVNDFRRADIAVGGQGAPLVPLFHAALAKALPKPLAIVNIGGIANITYIGTHDEDMLAFDTGPGNALMNQLAEKALAKGFDEDGATAAAGRVNESALAAYMANPYFAAKAPKSLDRHDFDLEEIRNLTTADAMRTLLEVTAQSIAQSAKLLPESPKQWIVAGGGAYNPTLMARLGSLLGHVRSADVAGWSAEALEAQAFGFLAVRALRGLPLTLPQLTGGRHPQAGGAFYRV